MRVRPLDFRQRHSPGQFRRCSPGVRVAGAGLALAVLLASPCHAQSFSVLLERARSGDPTYLGARTAVDAADARKRQAAGALRPQVSLAVNANTNDRDYRTRLDAVLPAQDRYSSSSSQLTITQPLWRYANIVGWQQAEAIAGQAAHQLAAAEQDLFARLVTAWFDVLAARDSVLFTARQAATAQRFWETVQRGEALGSHGLPQAEEARARFDQALADALTAETDAQLKQAALEQIVGGLRAFVPPFVREQAELADVEAEALATWLARAEEGNPGIQAAAKALEAAADEERKQRAGHQPTLDLVGNYGKNSQMVGGFPGQAGYDIRLGSIGLQLNVPIFSGGTQSAKVDEAAAQKEKARLDLEAARRNAALAVKQAWFGWRAAHARTQAGLQSIRSANAALQAARLGVAQGAKTELDRLQAEQQWRAASRDFRKGRYDQVMFFVKLKAAGGMLTAGDVEALGALFVDSEEQAHEMAPLRTAAVGEGA